MDNDGCGTLFWLAFFGAVAWFGWLDDSKFRYELQYDEVSYEKKPHDCEFGTAPLGRKNCKYEKEVSLILWSVSVDGEPIISYDNGETWYLNKGGPTRGKRATIRWVKQYD